MARFRSPTAARAARAAARWPRHGAAAHWACIRVALTLTPIAILPPQPRRKKDRNAPKRPRNAYLVFLDRHRPALQAAQPHSAMKDLTREMAKEWQTVSAEERKICDDIAQANKAAYEEAMRRYHEQQTAGGGAAAVDVDDSGAAVRDAQACGVCAPGAYAHALTRRRRVDRRCKRAREVAPLPADASA